MIFNASYLIRLDDACHTEKKEIWERFESVFDEFKILPIIAVIPNCTEQSLRYDNYDVNFWDRIRCYQQKGYTIAMHGYEHIYLTKLQGIVPLNRVSEFAGLPLGVQRERIKKAYNIMLSENIKPQVWIAPAHSFDGNTLSALKFETNIRVVSDGFAFYPYGDKDFFWIPQQLWKLRWMPPGVWTICLHPNNMTIESCDKIIIDLKRFRRQIISFDDILKKKEHFKRKKNLLDYFLEKALILKFKNQ